MKLVAQRGAGDLMVRTMDNHNTEGGIQENCVWTILHMSLKSTHAHWINVRWVALTYCN